MEEIESMGRGEKRALEHRLTVIFLHRLKWLYQPVQRGRNWKPRVDQQLLKFQKQLADNPGLKARLNEIIADAHEISVLQAAEQTRLETDSVSPLCPWSYGELYQPGFYPD